MSQEITILLAEDDENDILLLQQAFQKNSITTPILVFRDGEEILHYLNRIPPYDNGEQFPSPSILFLDIKLPKRSGLEVLSWMRSHPQFRTLPVMMLTSSKLERDIAESYELGANSYMVKPAGFEELKRMVKLVYEFWAACEMPKLKE